MQFKSIEKPLILVIGPTAVGKSDFSIQLAERIEGEIISADSRNFYRGMNIGTAKPSKTDMARIPHHLINIADPNEVISLDIFKKLAGKAINEVIGRNRIPILVGGTGQYIRAIVEGWKIPEGKPNPRMRKVLEKMGDEVGKVSIHHKLSILDPHAAKSIDPANVRRTVRAMEVILSSGIRFSDQRMKEGCPYSTLTIGLTRPRKELFELVDLRIEKMIEDGLKNEVIQLIKSGYNPLLPSMSAIGYKEFSQVIMDEINEEEAIVLIKKRTRIFIRRQSAWFRRDDPGIHWFVPGNQTLIDAVDLIQNQKEWVKPTMVVM